MKPLSDLPHSSVRRAMAGLLASAAVACTPELPAMTPEEARQIEALTARMTPRCVGRYLIDLPEQFVLNTQSLTELEGVSVTVEPMAERQFRDALARRKGDLESRTLPINNHPMLRAASPIEGGLVFDRAKSDASSGRASRVLEAWIWRAGFKLHAEIEAFDGTFPEDAHIQYHREHGSDVPAKMQHLIAFASRLSGRRDDEIPTEQGVCFANGFLKGPPTEQEWFNMHHQWSAVPDVYLTYRYHTDTGPQNTTLLQRGAAIEADLKSRKGVTLRKGARADAPVHFDEWLSEKEGSGGARVFRAALEANSLAVSAHKPLLIINMLSGAHHPRPAPTLEEAATRKPVAMASLSSSAAIPLWDAITRTIRPRPGAF